MCFRSDPCVRSEPWRTRAGPGRRSVGARPCDGRPVAPHCADSVGTVSGETLFLHYIIYFPYQFYTHPIAFFHSGLVAHLC